MFWNRQHKWRANVSILYPETVLEISAVPEYFGTIRIRVLRKIKKKWFSGEHFELFEGHEKQFFLFF